MYDALRAARTLRGTIEEEADAVEKACTMTPPVVEALDRAGLFRLSTPRDLGGLEADVATIVDVCEELAFADDSVGPTRRASRSVPTLPTSPRSTPDRWPRRAPGPGCSLRSEWPTRRTAVTGFRVATSSAVARDMPSSWEALP